MFSFPAVLAMEEIPRLLTGACEAHVRSQGERVCPEWGPPALTLGHGGTVVLSLSLPPFPRKLLLSFHWGTSRIYTVPRSTVTC